MENETTHIDQFLLIHSVRNDSWRDITTLADAWAANRGERAALERAIAAGAAAEEYHAYPGARLLREPWPSASPPTMPPERQRSPAGSRTDCSTCLPRAFERVGRSRGTVGHRGGRCFAPRHSRGWRPAALFRSVVCQQSAGGAMASVCGRDPQAAPAGRPLSSMNRFWLGRSRTPFARRR